ncbi:hypothetical protein [Parapedobacter sp. DT-150]|uniref:hypothetical protein n=1 Tax=Parapedobacter sp. DT-150 TaxID=3396162 RepID=UPI003F1B192F
MIRVFFIVMFSCLFTTGAHSQITRDLTFQIVFPDTSNRHFFAKQHNISLFTVDFEKGIPISLSLYYSSKTQHPYSPLDNQDPDEFYDLEFDGDLYRLSKKYKQITMPVLPTLTMQYLPNITDRQDIKTYYDVKALIYKDDSIAYQFSQYHHPDDPDIAIYTSKQRKEMFDAKFKGGGTQLAKILEANYNEQQQVSVKDSILIFRGVVHRDGFLNDVELIQGQQSQFSNFIQQSLEESSKSWIPARQGGRSVMFAVNIYVRLNNDDSIMVSTNGEYKKTKQD